MKTLIKAALVALFMSVSYISHAQIDLEPESDTVQTEEYAIISVIQYGKKNLMSVTIGSESTDEKEFAKEKADKKYDMAPVIAEMERLNRMGFKLFSSSASIYIMNDYSYPFYNYVFVRKKKGE